MSEFKGKWERITVDWDLHQAVFVEDREIEICRLKGAGVETVATALLISKAPEMLEMLKNLYNDLKQGALPSEEEVQNIQQLIKEATTI